MADAPDSLAEYRRDLGRALKLIDHKTSDYITGREYYDGTRAEVAASREVRALVQANAEAHPISLAHIPVDVVIDKVELTDVGTEDARGAVLLATAMEENDLADEFDDWLHKAGYFGDYYAIVDPTDETDRGDVTALRVVGSSPLSTIVMYDKKDGRTALYGVKRWQDKDELWHALVYYDDCTIKLHTLQKSSTLDPNAFELDDDGEEGGERVDHPGERMLIAHLAIDGKPYGRPLHARAYGPQDAITKVSATNLSNVDAQGFASRWAVSDPLAEIDDDIDDDFGTDGPDTTPEKSDGRTTAVGQSRVRSMPGSIALLRGVKQVGQFAATGSDDFLKNLDWYVRVMAVACGVALFEFDMNGEQPSGESRRRAEGRSTRHARKVRRSAGSFLAELGGTMLAVLGVTAQVAATFAPLESSTDKEGLELVGTKIANGVPVGQALLEAGYTEAQVGEWYPDGAPHVTPALLTTLAAALAQLGTAKTLGVITDDELRDMLPTILTAARNEGPVVDDDTPLETETDGMVTNPAEVVKAKADAVGALIRAGADPEQAAEMVGLGGLTFPNVPTTVRIPENDASDLEGSAPAAPAAPVVA